MFSNLRQVTRVENLRNQKRYSNNTSGAVGVYWHKREKKWEAGIRVKGKYIFLGYFDDKEEAVAAREKAERRYGFHLNHGRAA